jgi:hypothetical protein
MKRTLWLMVLAAIIGAGLSGCASPPSGSKEYKPGQGWVPA